MQGYGLVNQCTKGGYHISQQKKKVLLGNVTCRGTYISFRESVPEWFDFPYRTNTEGFYLCLSLLKIRITTVKLFKAVFQQISAHQSYGAVYCVLDLCCTYEY